MMITAEGLETAGYRRFTGGSAGMKDSVAFEALWQKRVEDGSGIRYFINLNEWRLERIARGYQGATPTFPAEAQFALGAGCEDTFTVSLNSRPGLEIAEVERFFDDVWTRMGAGYYERFSHDRPVLLCGDCADAADAADKAAAQ